MFWTWTWEIVEQQLAEQSFTGLRKETKRIRYQMEVFSDFVSTYEVYLQDHYPTLGEI